MKSGQKRDGGVKKKLSCCPNDDGTIVRAFRVEDYDAVIALWRRTEGVGLNESDTRRAIAAFEKLDARKFGVGEPIDVGALVEMESSGEKSAYFIGPRAGGTEVLYDKREVLVITPQSPLGEQLLGRKQGEVLKLKLAGVQNQYRVATIA